MKKINVGIIEDNHFLGQGMAELLKKDSGIKILFNVDDHLKIHVHAAGEQPTVLILDVSMNIDEEKFVIAELHEKYALAKLIVISLYCNDANTAELFACGIYGFLQKRCDLQKLLGVIYMVNDGGHCFDSNVDEVSQHQHNSGDKNIKPELRLNEKQKKIVKLICEEKSNGEIAAAVFLSKRRLENLKREILVLTGCKNIAGLVLYAIRNGIIDPPPPHLLKNDSKQT